MNAFHRALARHHDSLTVLQVLAIVPVSAFWLLGVVFMPVLAASDPKLGCFVLLGGFGLIALWAVLLSRHPGRLSTWLARTLVAGLLTGCAVALFFVRFWDAAEGPVQVALVGLTLLVGAHQLARLLGARRRGTPPAGGAASTAGTPASPRC